MKAVSRFTPSSYYRNSFVVIHALGHVMSVHKAIVVITGGNTRFS